MNQDPNNNSIYQSGSGQPAPGEAVPIIQPLHPAGQPSQLILPGSAQPPIITLEPPRIKGPRETKLIIAAATKRGGKTFTTLCKIEQNVKYIPNVQDGRKWLIYDVNMEYGNDTIALHGKNRGKPFEFQTKTLALNDLAAYAAQKRPEVRRILPVDDKGQIVYGQARIGILNRILQEYRSGGLLLEDINGYLIGSSTKEIISALTTNAHKDIDIYIHLQSLSKVSTTMFENADYFRLHFQMDDMRRYANRIPSFEKFLIAEKLIKLKYKNNTRFNLYVENKLHKISGYFSMFEYQTAVYAYLMDNKSLIKEAISRSEYSTGGKINGPEAISRCIKERMHYYGNEEAA